MRQAKDFFILGAAVCFLILAGCDSAKNNVPKIQNASFAAGPALKVVPSQSGDSVHVQNALVLPAVPDPNADFFIKPHPTLESPTEKNGAKFDHAIDLNGKKLTLRGVTVRKFEMSSISLLTIYTVALYMPENTNISGDIPDTERLLILEYHLDVPKEKVVQAIRESVYSNPDVSIPAVEADFQKLSAAFDSPRKGYRYEFPYIPGRGTAMIKANQIMTLIPGKDFAEAFFGIWLSPHGSDLQMRCELMALPCPEKSLLNPVNAVSTGLGEAKQKLGKLKNLIP